VSSKVLGDSIAFKNASLICDFQHGEESMGLLCLEGLCCLLLFCNNNSFNGNVCSIGGNAGDKEKEIVVSVDVELHLGSYLAKFCNTNLAGLGNFFDAKIGFCLVLCDLLRESVVIEVLTGTRKDFLNR